MLCYDSFAWNSALSGTYPVSLMKINISGLCFGYTGMAQHTRYFSTALGSIHDVYLVAWDEPETEDDTVPRYLQTTGSHPDADVGIGIGPLERMNEITGRYRIGFVVWETTILPGTALRTLKELDEIWVPSAWGRSVLVGNGIPAERVFVIPEGVDPGIFRVRDQGTRDMSRPFRFLCVGKWENRKGIADLAIAYSREFHPSEPVELILHCFNPHPPGFNTGVALGRLGLPAHAPIHTSAPVSRTELVDLYNSCDVFVLPTRAEGWGLPIIEALSCGLPVIATNYSAHTEFLNNDNGYLIDVTEMIPVNDPYFYGTEPAGVWAQPDIEHLQQLMRRAYREDAERKQKGQQARQDVIERWTWQHAAQKAHLRLQNLF